jgi:adenylate cyclase
MGRHEEAIAEIDRAHELDPQSPLVSYMKAYILFYARKYERSIEQCQKMIEMDPNYALPYTGLGKAYLQKGMYDEAILALQKAGNDSYLGLAYGLEGKRNEALGIFEEMVKQWSRGNSRASPITRIYFGLAENDLALDWLENSFERNEPRMIELKVDPFYDSLRSHPRFKAFLKKMNLE